MNWNPYSTYLDYLDSELAKKKLGLKDGKLLAQYRDGTKDGSNYSTNVVDVFSIINYEAKLTPKKIIVNGPATIVIWEDGSKTVVKKEVGLHVGYLSRVGEDNFAYYGFLAALAKKIFGNNSHLKRVIKDATRESTK